MRVKVTQARLSFPVLFTPKDFNGDGNKKFSASLLIAKDSPQVATLRDVIAQVAAEKWKDKATATLKALAAKDAICLHDGDNKAEYAGFEGHYYLNASSTARPTLVDQKREALVEADGKPYAGCYVNAVVDIWAMDNQYGKRVCATLAGVQFAKDGEAFSGSAAASPDEFDELEGEGDDDFLA